MANSNIVDFPAPSAQESFDINLVADVLIIGGGPAGAWAGLAAARAGARVVVAEKGYLGTSGAQAAAGTGAYYIKPDDPQHREGMVNSRLPIAFGFAETEWIAKVYDQSFINQDLMSRWGYAFPRTQDGKQERWGGLRAGDAVLFLRKQLEQHGVTILDHSPALELLLADGAAAGATGWNRRTGKRWQVRAGAVVLATGGTAFRSGIAGGNNNTGDGYLLAVEAGAQLSGMEFSGQYGIVPKGSACSKTAVYGSATLTDAHGQVVSRGKGTTIAEIQTGHLYCKLDKYDDIGRQRIQAGQPMTFQYFKRHLHIDPFTQEYEVEHILEGTIRASGGIEVGDGATTTVPGLFAAGDTTSREKLVGANQSGAGPATAWALASGSWAGHSATLFARKYGADAATRKVSYAGTAGLRPSEQARADLDVNALIAGVQEEVLPVAKFYRRDGKVMSAALEKLDGLWRDARGSLAGNGGLRGADYARSVVRAREAAALIAAARWIFASALERKESRGLQRRADYPVIDEKQYSHVIAGGLDQVWVKRKPVSSNAHLHARAS
ncbi:FAD-binding protein [Azoarcus indigens]|uniref:Succinate dehydrogenase/fumarate reductase flavoprotein subunit n=1 Tax=Azoarcus indigens TaxID=29545 RepID=A0A4R6EF01_9RHOO|nr:FAD-binding protein [Azoarcus indigens]NMG67718.1 FAD-binding protein [Azoarcus indigens]TDN56834.1 succinate dehydrogenase/fumarate reductase flavoprotein subunit [Azoarcus indigens]